MSSLSLNDLLKSLMTAAMDANKELHDHEIHAIKEHFKSNEKEGSLEPNTLKMKLPQKHLNEGEDHEQHVDIPTGALASHYSMFVDEMELNFDCFVESVNTLKSGGRQILVDLDSLQKDKIKTSRMMVKVKIKSGDPSEGVSKIHDALNRKI